LILSAPLGGIMDLASCLVGYMAFNKGPAGPIAAIFSLSSPIMTVY